MSVNKTLFGAIPKRLIYGKALSSRFISRRRSVQVQPVSKRSGTIITCYHCTNSLVKAIGEAGAPQSVILFKGRCVIAFLYMFDI